jgi:hypothetical protein
MYVSTSKGNCLQLPASNNTTAIHHKFGELRTRKPFLIDSLNLKARSSLRSVIAMCAERANHHLNCLKPQSDVFFGKLGFPPDLKIANGYLKLP